jgi:site-specific recombinase XerC
MGCRLRTRAAADFLAWCAAGVASIIEVQPLHVAAWIERQTQTLSPPTAKQRLAAIRHLFDWLVVGQIVPHNPAASVGGPLHEKRQNAGARAERGAAAAGQHRCEHTRGPARSR